MLATKIEMIKSVYEQFPWDSREDYRVLRKVRPDFDLPSDTEISNVWGSFSEFKKILNECQDAQCDSLVVVCDKDPEEDNQTKFTVEWDIKPDDLKEETILSDKSKQDLQNWAREELDEKTKSEIIENGPTDLSSMSFGYTEYPEGQKLGKVDFVEIPKKRKLTDKQKILYSVKSAFSDCLDFTRTQYRETRKSNPSLDLPSCDKIAKLFGTFGNFKEELKKDFILEEKPETEEDKIAALVRSVWNTGEDLTRNDYRQKRKDRSDLDLPSCDKIAKLFGSFGKFKDYIIGEYVAEESNISDEWNPTPEELAEIKKKVKLKRKVMFGVKRKPYEWEPGGRKGYIVKKNFV